MVDNYDKNPNIRYVVNGSGQTLNTTSQSGIADPFVSKDSINQKIRNESKKLLQLYMPIILHKNMQKQNAFWNGRG
jgi:hypothetical protein